jgi:NAD(P)H-nitrite reductase large subunit
MTTWWGLRAAIVKLGVSFPILRLRSQASTLLGAVVMGDQKLSLPLQKIIANKVDISPIRQRLLNSNAKVGDVIAEFWASQT